MLLNVPWGAKSLPVRDTDMEVPFWLFPVIPLLPEVAIHFYFYTLVLPVLELYINKSTLYVPFCVWHRLLSVKSMRFTFVIVPRHFHYISILCIVLRSPVDEQLGWFQCLTL